MKSLFLFPVIYFGLAFTNFNAVAEKEVLIRIHKESELTISGSTNINKFKCGYKIDKIEQPIIVTYERTEKALVFHQTVLELDNNCFDCGSRPINRDFKVLVKSEKYPSILLELDRILQKEGISADVLAEIQIAGITKPYKVPVTIIALEDNTFNVSGTLKLNISDFKLKPPKKVFGLIEVDDTIEIGFKLLLKSV